MTEIEKTKKEIEVLQQKLKKLEAQEPKMTLKESGNCYEVLYDHKYYYRIEFPTGYKWIKRPIGSYTWYPVDEPDIVLELEQVFNNLNDNEEKIEEAYRDYRKEREAKTLKEKDWSYAVTDEYGETNPYKQYLYSVKMKELGFVKNSDGNWTANPLATKQESQKKDGKPETLYEFLEEWSKGYQFSPYLNQYDVYNLVDRFTEYLYEYCEFLEEDSEKLIVRIPQKFLVCPDMCLE